VIFHSTKIFLLICIFLSQNLLAQENNAKYTYSLGADFFTGFIVKHHEDMGHLITGHPSGIRLNFSKYSYGTKAWEQRYGYPTFTTTLSYYNLKNDEVLGKIVALNTGLGFHLNNFEVSKNDIQAYFGFGLAYITNPYNAETNNKNNVISTYWPLTFNLRISYDRQVSSRIKAGIALQLSHFSNAARAVPNYGINIANFNIGVKYLLTDSHPAYRTDKLDDSDFNKKSYFNIDFRFGRSALTPVGSGASPYYAISLFWNKQVSPKSILDTGIEGFANKAIEKQILLNQALVEGSPDYRTISIMIGHEFLLHKMSLVTQLGVYVYKPYQSIDRIYSKVGIKYYFTDHIYGSLILKTHYAVAEVLEYGIGIRI